MKKSKFIIYLIILVIGLGATSIYISNELSKRSTNPEEVSAAYPKATCSNGCDSGKECNGGGNPDPDPGKMWSCVSSKCVQTTTNSKGGFPDCYLKCSPYGWYPCDCDTNACNTECKKKLTGSTTYATYTMTCAGCGQKFTCDCSRTLTNTPTKTHTPTVPVTTTVITKTSTPTNTPTAPVTTTVITKTNTPTNTPTVPVTTTVVTNTPTHTPTVTFTNTPTSTPSNTPTATPTATSTITPTHPLTTTLPPTALITDEVDRVIIGISMIFIGLMLYQSGAYLVIGNSFWAYGGKSIWNTSSKRFNKLLNSFSKAFSTFDNKVLNIYDSIVIASMSVLNKVSMFFKAIGKIIHRTGSATKSGIKKKITNIGLGEKEKFEKELLKKKKDE